MRKRIVSLLLAALMAAVLPACGTKETDGESLSEDTREESSGQEESVSPESSADTQESVPEENTEVTAVTIWDSDSGRKEFLDEMVERFNSTVGKENHVEIVVEHMENGDYAQQLSVAFQNGVEPDLVTVSAASLAEYAEKGYLAPLDDIAGLGELIQSSNATPIVRENAWGGKMYMIQSEARVIGLAYNKDMFVKAGIVDENGNAKPPATLAEMVEDARLLTDVGSQEFGFCVPVGWGSYFNYYLAYPAQASSGVINGIYDYKTGEFNFSGIRAVAEAYLQMKEDGSLYPGAEGLDNDPARARFAEGGIGMMMTAQWDCAVWNDQFPAKCDWGVAAVPVEDADNAYLQYSACSYSRAITAKGVSEGREEAIALVFNYLEGEEMLVRGCERGMLIPWNSALLEKCDFSNSPKGWSEYCNLRAISSPVNYPMKSTDLDGMDKYPQDFTNNVWSGQQTLDDWISVMDERYSQGAQRFMDNNPDLVEVMEGRIDPGLDLSR